MGTRGRSSGLVDRLLPEAAAPLQIQSSSSWPRRLRRGRGPLWEVHHDELHSRAALYCFTASAVWGAVPAIALLASYLWLSIITVGWAVLNTTFHGSLIGAAVLVVVLAPAGGYLTVKLVGTAVQAERDIQ